MSENDTVYARLLSDGSVVRVLPDGSTEPFPDRTDWKRLAEMTEEEIEANALSDPDNPPISDEELKFFRHLVNVREIRQRQRLTQKQFSDRYRIPLGTLRDWEQRGRYPGGVATTLLRIIDKYPDIVLEVLAEEFGASTIEIEKDDNEPTPATPGPTRRAGAAVKQSR
jgi:putative transcriptional regulator